MFVYNVKINGSKVFKSIFILMCILVLCIVGIVVFKIIIGSQNSHSDEMCILKDSVFEISSKNYTNALKAVHDNIDDYVGTKIKFTGYVYRVLDLQENQFVLARDMIISSNYQSVIVGFLCEYGKAKDFKDDTWVEITGTIIKGNYHGDMPIVKITSMNEVKAPNDDKVYPPDDTYIPTAGMV